MLLPKGVTSEWRDFFGQFTFTFVNFTICCWGEVDDVGRCLLFVFSPAMLSMVSFIFLMIGYESNETADTKAAMLCCGWGILVAPYHLMAVSMVPDVDMLLKRGTRASGENLDKLRALITIGGVLFMSVMLLTFPLSLSLADEDAKNHLRQATIGCIATLVWVLFGVGIINESLHESLRYRATAVACAFCYFASLVLGLSDPDLSSNGRGVLGTVLFFSGAYYLFVLESIDPFPDSIGLSPNAGEHIDDRMQAHRAAKTNSTDNNYWAGNYSGLLGIDCMLCFSEDESSFEGNLNSCCENCEKCHDDEVCCLKMCKVSITWVQLFVVCWAPWASVKVRLVIIITRHPQTSSPVLPVSPL